MNFRKDINELRAIAVIAVVLFHFNSSWMPGGFAGVDVFFVISGFLMTGIIFKGMEQKSFSIFNFYVARANRIIPALAVLCLALLIFGWLYLAPIDYRELGKHTGGSIVFLSNLFYLRESGYFDVSSKEKWLLHTWSLSVEWQFYIIYPLILVAIRNFLSIKAVKATVLLGAVVSFICCIVATYKWPDYSYYLLPTRAWEMMVGGIAYLYPISLKEERKKLLEIVGLALIVGSYLLISKDSPWPGYLAILPVLGSFIIIQAQRNNSLVTGNAIFQKLGAWSYSIYLWHWPLVVAIYYFSLNDIFIYYGIALSVLLGFISNKYIEKINFENNFVGVFQYLKCLPIYMLLIVGLLGASVLIKNGFVHRNEQAFKASQASRPKHYDYCFDDVRNNKTTEYCAFHNDGSYDKKASSANIVGVIVLGDSHASSMVISILDSMRKSGNKSDLLFYGHPGCLPLGQEIVETYYKDSCNYRNSNILDFIKNNSNSNTKIIISSRLPMYIYGYNDKNSENKKRDLHYMSSDHDIINNRNKVLLAFQKLISDIKPLSNKIYVVLPVPEQELDIPKTNAKNIMLNIPEYRGVPYARYADRNKFINKFLGNIKDIKTINPALYLCDSNLCVSTNKGNALYYDSTHLSVYGSKYISPIFDDIW